MRKLIVLGLSVMIAIGVAPKPADALSSSTWIMYSCNPDGTYNCGGDCTAKPYNGRGCCVA